MPTGNELKIKMKINLWTTFIEPILKDKRMRNQTIVVSLFMKGKMKERIHIKTLIIVTKLFHKNHMKYRVKHF